MCFTAYFYYYYPPIYLVPKQYSQVKSAQTSSTGNKDQLEPNCPCITSNKDYRLVEDYIEEFSQ